MKPGADSSKYRIFIVLNDGTRERWYSFPKYDIKGLGFQQRALEERILQKRLNNKFKLAIFEEVASGREIKRYTGNK